MLVDMGQLKYHIAGGFWNRNTFAFANLTLPIKELCRVFCEVLLQMIICDWI